MKLKVKCGKEFSEPFQTDTGGPQGDSSSANEFTFYLAKALVEYYDFVRTSPTQHDHNYTKPSNFTNTDHNYFKKTQNNFQVDMQYADDISEINTNKLEIDHLKKHLPQVLRKKRDLNLNEKKTEEYVISSKTNKWKECKFLGSFIDTEKDIANRKGKAIEAANSDPEEIFKNKKLPISVKVDALNIYVGSVFLYNSEIWTLTQTLNDKIDSFHRRLLRKYVLNVKYPKLISNAKVYEKTKVTKWSTIVGKRRLTWFGHVNRLHEDAPARKALQFALSEYKQKRGRPKLTWLKQVEKQLREIDVHGIDVIISLAKDKNKWNDIVTSWLQKVARAT